MRDVLLVVAVVGVLFIAFMLALVASKYGKAIQSDVERRPSEAAERPKRD
jgi:hypothetical protein